MSTAVVLLVGAAGLYCLLRWAITAPAINAAIDRHPAGRRRTPAGRHRGDLAARLVAVHRREQVERELGWGEK